MLSWSNIVSPAQLRPLVSQIDSLCQQSSTGSFERCQSACQKPASLHVITHTMAEYSQVTRAGREIGRIANVHTDRGGEVIAIAGLHSARASVTTNGSRK